MFSVQYFAQGIKKLTRGKMLMFLQSLVQSKLKAEKLSIRRAAHHIGISHTTLASFLQGSTVDLDTVTRVCQWLNISVRTALGFDTDSDTASAVAAILEAEPELGDIFRQAAESVSAGELPAEDFREIIQYAAIRLRMAKERRLATP
jgi:transcriptional regulator with XRE-family HTH domain